jgi:aminomethyltransferase
MPDTRRGPGSTLRRSPGLSKLAHLNRNLRRPAMANLRTPLYDWHVSRKARIVEFGGWDMPVQYSSIIEEHTAVRTGAGLFDISHMGRLSFSGTDALALIQHVWSNNAATMKESQVRYGLICNEQGGIRDDVLVYRWSDGWAMVVNASNRDKITGWLAQHRGKYQASISDQTLDTCMIAVQGPRAVAQCAGLTEADVSRLNYYFSTATRYRGKDCVVSRTGYTGEDGLEIMIGKEMAVVLWEDLVARGAKPCGLGARDTLRLEAAMPLYGHELSETIDPIQAGLGWAVKLDKGEFVGSGALRRPGAGKPVRVGLVLDGKRAAREGSAVLRDGREIGRVTSGSFGPTVQKSIAMAFIDPAHATAGTVLLVDIRGDKIPGTVVKLPFYQRAR